MSLDDLDDDGSDMSTSLLKLPRNLAGNPTVSGLAASLSRTKSRARELGKLADQAQTPAGQTLSVQGGAAASGALRAFLTPDRAAMGTAALAGLAILGGAIWESPEAIGFGNGLLAPWTATKVEEFLTRRNAPAAAPAPETKAA